MYHVISNEILAPNLHKMVVLAPRVALARKAGQFVIVRADRGDERIPLTIGDADPAAGTITLFIQAIGASTRKIVAIPQGGSIRDVAGPLGQATHIENRGRVACVGGGVGTAVLFPLVKALAAADEQKVLRLWEGLGYYRRARALHQGARQICVEHGGRVPNDPDLLGQLPGLQDAAAADDVEG